MANLANDEQGTTAREEEHTTRIPIVTAKSETKSPGLVLYL